MENLTTRFGSVTVLAGVLIFQVVGLAVQVKRTNSEQGTTRLVRIWAVSAVTPFEKALVWCQKTTSSMWHNYFYLRDVRAENRELKQQIERMRLEQVRLADDAEQARRLQLLLGFKERFISKTLAAQVIGTSGSEQSRAVYIDKGSRDGIETDQAVITADGVVGKVLRVFNSTALVLLINDQTSGVGVILEKSRLQGVLHGTASGQVALEKIMNDEGVQTGEQVLTSGGDRIFPKGLPVGTVQQVKNGTDSFLDIRLRPSANLNRLEEVLIVTKVEDKTPVVQTAGPIRAVDVLTLRLPSVPDKPAIPDPKATATAPGTAAAGGVKPGTPASGPTTTATGVATPKAPAPKVSGQMPNAATSPAKPSGAGASGTAVPQSSAPSAPKPAISNSTTTIPAKVLNTTGNPASPTKTVPAAAKPAAANPDAPAGNTKPVVVPKAASGTSKSPDKSAKPASEPPKPDAPPEDKPQ